MAPSQAALYRDLGDDLEPVVVGGRASGAGAHEARASAAPVPREVRAAAGRGLAPQILQGRTCVLDPFAGSGTTLVQATSLAPTQWGGYLRVQLPPGAGEGRLVRPLPAGDVSASRVRGRSSGRPRQPISARQRRLRAWFSPDALPSSLPSGRPDRLDEHARCLKHHALAVRSVHPGSRPTSTSTSASARTRGLLVPQAPSYVRARAEAGASCADTCRRRGADPCFRAVRTCVEARVLHGDSRVMSLPRETDRRWSPRLRIRLSSTTTSSTATPTSSLASTTEADRRDGRRGWWNGPEATGSYRDAMTEVFATRGS